MLNNKPNRDKEINQQFSLFKKGDQRAFRFFYELHHRALFNFVRNLLRYDAVAEEIINDAFIALGNRQQRINNPEHLKRFLYRVARHKTIENLMKLKERAEHENAYADKYFFEWAMQVDEVEVIKENTLSLIYAEIENLPSRQREVAILRFKKGMTVRDIALQLNTSEKNVYKHLSKVYQYFVNVFPRNELMLILLMTLWG